jgi:hypothetical protein
MFGLSNSFIEHLMKPGACGLLVFQTHRERIKYSVQHHRAFEAVGTKYNTSNNVLTFTWGATLLLYAVTADDHHRRLRGAEFSAVEFLGQVGALEEAFIRGRVRGGANAAVLQDSRNR